MKIKTLITLNRLSLN